jgi:hypothetical protein
MTQTRPLPGALLPEAGAGSSVFYKLVYAPAEKKLRQVMAKSGLTVPNQKGKATSMPTIRGVFQLFAGILVLYIRDDTKINTIIMNMKEENKIVIRAFGTYVEKMYFFDSIV